MQKYVEELQNGECFMYLSKMYLLTIDFKKSKDGLQKKGVNINDGSFRWMSNNDIVDVIDLFYRDKENNILLCREYKDENDTKNQKFS